MPLVHVITILFALVALSCKRKPHQSESSPEEAFDGQPLVKVQVDASNVPERYRNVMDAVGMSTVAGDIVNCTVTHIGDGVGIGAGHCFGAAQPLERDVPCTNLIAWGFVGDKARLVSRCTRIIARQDLDTPRSEVLDFAIIQMYPLPPSSVRIETKNKPRLNSKLTIFGYPQGEGLHWAGVCQLLPAVAPFWTASIFPHRCTTEGGMSGSAILADDDFRVIGIHNGGAISQGANYATFLSDPNVAEILDSLPKGRDVRAAPSKKSMQTIDDFRHYTVGEISMRLTDKGSVAKVTRSDTIEVSFETFDGPAEATLLQVPTDLKQPGPSVVIARTQMEKSQKRFVLPLSGVKRQGFVGFRLEVSTRLERRPLTREFALYLK